MRPIEDPRVCMCVFFSVVSGSRVIPNWQTKHVEGSIFYHPSTGRIQVKRKGYYFIYSQIYFIDGSGLIMGHSTCINEFRVMASIGSVISAERKYNTKYHGSVFLLQENDTISVRLPSNTRYSMNSEASFFGAFLLRNAVRKGKQILMKT